MLRPYRTLKILHLWGRNSTLKPLPRLYFTFIQQTLSNDSYLVGKYIGSAEKVFRWGLGGWGMGDGFYRFSGGQLPNFQGKST